MPKSRLSAPPLRAAACFHADQTISSFAFAKPGASERLPLLPFGIVVAPSLETTILDEDSAVSSFAEIAIEAEDFEVITKAVAQDIEIEANATFSIVARGFPFFPSIIVDMIDGEEEPLRFAAGNAFAAMLLEDLISDFQISPQAIFSRSSTPLWRPIGNWICLISLPSPTQPMGSISAVTLLHPQRIAGFTGMPPISLCCVIDRKFRDLLYFIAFSAFSGGHKSLLVKRVFYHHLPKLQGLGSGLPPA